MPHVFVSYSRNDSDFAKLLVVRLQSSGFESWLDQEDIPPAENWRDELELGIVQSDNFLFLISPDSLSSKECTKERLIAVEAKKRTIPVVVRHPLNDQTIGDDLSNPQQINALSGLSDSVFAQISSAIMRDLPWKRQSTEYLNLANKWKEGKGSLLGPAELGPARNWRKAGDNISPGPTNLQLQFIDESERTHMASRFVVNADRFIEREPDRALLFAAEGCALVDTPWTKRVLVAILDRHRALFHYLHDFRNDPATEISDIGFSRDGSTLAATGVLDAITPEPMETGLRCWYLPSLSLRRQILMEKGLNCLSWGYTADDIALGKGMTVAILGIGKGNLTGRKLEKHSQWLRRIAIDPTGSFLASGDDSGAMFIWRLEDGERFRQFDKLGKIQSLAWSDDGRRLLAAGHDMALLLTGPEFNNPREYRFDGWIWAADLSPDGTHAAFLAKHNFRDHCLIHNHTKDQWRGWKVPQHKGILFDIRFSRDARFIFTAGGGGSCGAENIVQWDIAEAEPVQTLLGGFKHHISRLAVSPDDRLLAAGGSERKVILWDYEMSHALPNLVQRWESDATAIATSPAGGYATGLVDGLILISNSPGDGDPYQLASENSTAVTFLHFNQAGDRLAAVDKENVLTVWDLNLKTRLARVHSGHDGRINGVAFSKTGRFVATSGNDGTIFLLSGTNLDVIHHIAPENTRFRMLSGARWPILSIAFDPDESVLVSGSINNILRFWDVQTGELSRSPLIGGFGSTDSLLIQNIAFSANGKQLLWSSGFHTYLLSIDQLDHLPTSTIFVNTQTIEARLVRRHEHLDNVTAATFSPDSHSYASSGGGQLLLCDSREDEPVGRLTCLSSIMSLNYSADGKTLLCLTDDGAVLHIELSVTSWIELARHKANRSLTDEERKQFGQ